MNTSKKKSVKTFLICWYYQTNIGNATIHYIIVKPFVKMLQQRKYSSSWFINVESAMYLNSATSWTDK